MKGRFHEHFESQYDTANGDFKNMIRSYNGLGIKKVAVTDHGAFSAYEDVLTACDDLRSHGEEIDIEFIPGVEGYFCKENDITKSREQSHIILFAKDYEGYQSLCHIITQSNKDFRKIKKDNGKPIITLKNLEENVSKGHLYCTTACIAGVFGNRFGLNRDKLNRRIEAQIQKVSKEPLDKELLLPIETLKSRAFQSIRNLNYAPKKSKNETKQKIWLVKDLLKKSPESEAEKYLYRYHVTRANFAIAEALRKEKAPKGTKTHPVSPLAMQYFEERKNAYETIKDYKEKKLQAVLFSTLQKHIEELNALPDKEKEQKECKALYNKFIKIFGKEFFYFELQNHGLAMEKEIYRRIIDFAKEVDNTNHFIASNDVHIGISKEFVKETGRDWDTAIEEEVKRRDVIQFTRYNKFFHDDDSISEDSYEYYIKSEEELREWISYIIPEEEILDNAFSNLEKIADACHVEFPKGENHYPAFCDNPEELFDKKIAEGIKKRFPCGFPKRTVHPDGRVFTAKDYEERLAYESSIIKNMGYASYHLIVADYLEFGRKLGCLPDAVIQSEDCPLTMEDLDRYIEEHDTDLSSAYSIGPGRGSAVGSLCCYLLGISDIDPLPYGLLFERFLNPERISMPKRYWASTVNSMTQRCV